MTAQETIAAVRMLLDDSIHHYFEHEMMIYAINEAQLRVIAMGHKEELERMLMPLHEISAPLEDGYAVLNADTLERDIVLYPRGFVVSHIVGEHAYQYLREGDYKRRLGIETEDTRVLGRTPSDSSYYGVGQKYPRVGYYTIHTRNMSATAPLSFDSELYSIVFFNSSVEGTTGTLYYIRHPRPFYAGLANTDDDVALELPDEFHPLVVAIAAEYLNDADVGEEQRGDLQIPDARNRMRLDNIGS